MDFGILNRVEFFEMYNILSTKCALWTSFSRTMFHLIMYTCITIAKLLTLNRTHKLIAYLRKIYWTIFKHTWFQHDNLVMIVIFIFFIAQTISIGIKWITKKKRFHKNIFNITIQLTKGRKLMCHQYYYNCLSFYELFWTYKHFQTHTKSLYLFLFLSPPSLFPSLFLSFFPLSNNFLFEY